MSATDLPVSAAFQDSDYDEFVCNYCHCSTPGRPIILGHSARLACGQCAAAIVKLSICWVCGEMICRGDDCVSFGWCFWHKTCFSCLLYGSRAVAGRTMPSQVETERIATNGIDRKAVDLKAEILKPPLCAACEAETTRDTDESGDIGVMQACVDFVDTADGGMAKLRWQMINGHLSSSARDETERPWPMLRAGRESDTDMTNRRQEHGGREESRDLIWIDMADPLNGPVFQPHPLKPVPFCMTRSAYEMT